MVEIFFVATRVTIKKKFKKISKTQQKTFDNSCKMTKKQQLVTRPFQKKNC
jgi:hypothetical protein